MGWGTTVGDSIAAPAGKPVAPGNDVMVFGSALPVELQTAGYVAAFVTYHSAYNPLGTTPQIKYFYQALYRSGSIAALDNGACVVANASTSQIGVAQYVDSVFMDTVANTLQKNLSAGARANASGYLEVVGAQSGWRGLINFANGYASTDHQVRRLTSGQVVMRGLISTVPASPANGQKIADLPNSFLFPTAAIVVPVRTGTTAGVTGLGISAAGAITLDSGSSAMPSGYMYLNATWMGA